jgi:lipoprotein-anchoring transpeptidase ErfK/SrfK
MAQSMHPPFIRKRCKTVTFAGLGVGYQGIDLKKTRVVSLMVRRAVPSIPFCSHARWLRIPLAVVLSALALLAAEAPVQAQSSGSPSSNEASQPRKRAEMRRRPASIKAARAAEDVQPSGKKRKKGEADKKGPDAKSAARPLFAVVSLADQRVSIYNHHGLVARSVVSTGMAGHRTPTGIFTIIGRERYHHSNIYSGAPMPFMQRITWSGVAMHLGVVPGYPASHGCIRLPSRFAAELWGLTKIGERVVIAPRDTAPAEFADALLPVPKMQADPNAPDESAAADGGIVTGTTSSGEEVVQVASTLGEAQAAAAPSPAPRKLLNPIEFAAAYKVKAAAESAKAAKAAKDAFDDASAKTAEARRAVSELKAAEQAKAAADAKVASAAKALADAVPEAKAAADAAKAAADAELAAAEIKLNEARASEPDKTAQSFQAVRLWKEATAVAASALAESKKAARRSSPVSVLVSKKDQRVYVRQGLAPLLDAPASVRDPDAALGTHVYIASAAHDDGSSLKWSVISMPKQSGASEKAAASRKKLSREEKPAPAAAPRPASSPAEALERIEIPAEVRERISELLWTGGSLIITDQPLSGETSDEGTDLVVTMR